jgi:hypothetical protein
MSPEQPRVSLRSYCHLVVQLIILSPVQGADSDSQVEWIVMASAASLEKNFALGGIIPQNQQN